MGYRLRPGTECWPGQKPAAVRANATFPQNGCGIHRDLISGEPSPNHIGQRVGPGNQDKMFGLDEDRSAAHNQSIRDKSDMTQD